MSRLIAILLLFSVLPQNTNAQPDRRANFPLPTPAQLTWHDTEFYFFIHFGPNTFTDLEWGHGTETEDVFNPTGLDCDQWCRVAQQAGARGIVITAKHHDGFCLWPSQYSTHTVRESKWRDGKGDVLRDLSEACKRHGLKFGVYLSPWDKNHPKYGTSEYNDVYVNTLTELLTGYGELFEIWWDGANGEGPNGKKQVYDFHRFEKLAAKLQPNAVVFSDIGPGCRWAGNERGVIDTETNWCTLDTAGFLRGLGAPPTDTLNQGNVNGALWLPAECDVSIRPGWFYHKEQDDQVKTPEQLWEIYLKSVGRGANLILNVPPDQRGRIHERDSVSLAAFGKKVKEAFDKNLALGKPCRLGNGKHWFDAGVTDDHHSTFAEFEVVPGESFLEVDLKRKKKLNALLIREKISTHGQRVQSFKVEVLEGKMWREVARSTTIGARKILTFPEVKTRKVRISILAAKSPPLVNDVRIFRI